ncbi:MAG: spore cortex-lytic enzyme [Clostridia bacterium]|nr:spore cortex-lytic enzyme [Clostridia bacterium]
MKLKYHKLIAVVMSLVMLLQPQAYALSRRGSQGSEVRQIQQRLIQWGYLSGSVDGIYGAKTEAAVKRFQRNNGLTPDGIAGAATLSKMGISSQTTQSSSNNNIRLLAMLISGEARGETYEGQVAVGAVVLNRVKHASFPNSVAGVIYQNGAFTAVDDGQINMSPTDSCMKAARDAINGWDPSGGAIYYYNPSTATNQWIRSRPIIKRIGKHVFCK